MKTINKYGSKEMLVLSMFTVLFSILVSCHSEGDKQTVKPGESTKIQRVEVVVPKERSFNAELLITGTAMPNQKVMLHTMESGYVRVVHKDIGDLVYKGAVIVELDNPELYRMHEKLMAQVEAKKAVYERLKLTMEKTPDLTPKQVLEDAEAEYLSVRAELNAIEDRQGFLKVVAPFKGIISRRLVDHGALVQSGMSNTDATAIVEIQELDPIRLTIPLPETDADAVTKGMKVLVTFPGLPGESYEVKVSRTAGVLDFASKTMQVEIDIANPDGKIKPGMYAKVIMQISSLEDVLSLPVTAQVMYEDEFFVLVVKENRVERIPLRKGLFNKDFFEVLNPEIGAESQVIIQGKGLVKPGHIVDAVLKNDSL
ncbi:MAG: hypothetical protein COC01_09515 [Bacteroidetes bacterium]|nr:MAG: hypothetical protein COC01_09515 [Bacteroidota bacterium]